MKLRWSVRKDFHATFKNWRFDVAQIKPGTYVIKVFHDLLSIPYEYTRETYATSKEAKRGCKVAARRFLKDLRKDEERLKPVRSSQRKA